MDKLPMFHLVLVEIKFGTTSICMQHDSTLFILYENLDHSEVPNIVRDLLFSDNDISEILTMNCKTVNIKDVSFVKKQTVLLDLLY